MADNAEVVLFEHGKVKVTSQRVIGADGRSTPLAELVSAERAVQAPGNGWLTLGLLVGCFIALSGGWMLTGPEAQWGRGGALLVAGLAIAVVSWLAREFIKKWGMHVLKVETQDEESPVIFASRDAAEVELVLRAIRVAMQVGADAAGFRAVFQHPQLPGETRAEETEPPNLFW